MVWTVEDYIRVAPETHQVVLKQLRTFCRVLLPMYDERLHFGIPTYFKFGVAEVSFSGKNGIITLCVVNKYVAEKLADELDEAGCLRYLTPAAVDFQHVERVLQRCVNPLRY